MAGFVNRGTTGQSTDPELDLILRDLKVVLKSVSATITRLENYKKKCFNSISDEEISFESAEEDIADSLKNIEEQIEDLRQTPNLPRDQSDVNEAINQTVVQSVSNSLAEQSASPTSKIHKIKRKLELRRQESFNGINSEVSVHRDEVEVNVDVQTLKRRFEVRKHVEKNMGKPDENRNNQAVRHLSREDSAKVNRLLKYFKPLQ